MIRIAQACERSVGAVEEIER
ncbi:MAG: hypothetical protein JWN51_3541, partial [Phycisphaerales bacterium]|nr:hypothetical protein [Phycisphaerales bacterium]